MPHEVNQVPARISAASRGASLSAFKRCMSLTAARDRVKCLSRLGCLTQARYSILVPLCDFGHIAQVPSTETTRERHIEAAQPITSLEPRAPPGKAPLMFLARLSSSSFLICLIHPTRLLYDHQQGQTNRDRTASPRPQRTWGCCQLQPAVKYQPALRVLWQGNGSQGSGGNLSLVC